MRLVCKPSTCTDHDANVAAARLPLFNALPCVDQPTMSVRMPADKTARVRRHLHALPLSGEVPDRINVVLADARKHLVDKHTPDNWIVVHSARSLATWKQTLAVLCANTLQIPFKWHKLQIRN